MMRSVTEKHGGFGLVVTGADRQDMAVVVRAGMIRSGRASSGWAVTDRMGLIYPARCGRAR